jgi:DNA modification methylase
MNKIDLRQGDCLEVLKTIPDKSIDLVVTDPPYKIIGNGFKAVAGGFKDRDIFKNDIKDIKNGFDFRILDECERVLKKWNCYIYCNKDLLCDLICYFKSKNVFIDILTEHITNPIPFCNNTYLNDTDYILFVRESGVLVGGTYQTKQKYKIKQTNKKDKKLYKHPTCKYVELLETYIKNSSKENDTILDMFMGSGSTGVACVNTNRKFIGIELDETYYEIACERINNIKNKLS